MLKLYLDSSVIIKRYVSEAGTELVDEIFDRAEQSKLNLSLSAWNIGETLGVLDEKRAREWISETEFSDCLKKLVEELLKFLRLRVLNVIPVSSQILLDSWALILSHHIYEADAVQIGSHLYDKCNVLLSSDKELINTARKAGITAYNVPEEGPEIRRIIGAET
jgi:predicted nucleic acid-binding protein